ncbi:hypothetical protein AYJ57_02580 [Salipiger sp. CCB-MM3]|uniref:TM2 domain-containing protein n=1 Tax=Salipiger sp. CCB-MM3 TaxID=1792508 RepID=UPI00080AB2FE|nr:TM2 domain-containing protein [Salipiger sp. CCB-MM3]ANT59344.1 hypothetical protein AYJ57_02580 [Salipiger sp. CCB-MM3]
MSLTTEDKILIEQRVANDSKSTGVTYALWLFLGLLGIHRFYLGRTGSAVGMLLLNIVGAFTWMIGVGFVLYFILGIWWLVDAFLIPGMISADKDAIRAQYTH